MKGSCLPSTVTVNYWVDYSLYSSKVWTTNWELPVTESIQHVQSSKDLKWCYTNTEIIFIKTWTGFNIWISKCVILRWIHPQLNGILSHLNDIESWHIIWIGNKQRQYWYRYQHCSAQFCITGRFVREIFYRILSNAC